MNVVGTLVADLQAAKAVEPTQRAFSHPAITAQPLAGLNATAGDARGDVALAQSGAQGAAVVGLVGMELMRARARPAARPSNGFNQIDRRFEHLVVVHVGGRNRDAQRKPVSVDHKMALRARFAAVRWIRAGFFAPPGAGTVAASSEARLQSIWLAWPSRSSSIWCKRRHTLAFC